MPLTLTRFTASKAALLAAAVLALSACGDAGKVDAPSVPEVQVDAAVTLDDVLAHPRRDAERARDQFRNPKETLEFFEIAPGQRVAEIWPGWYTNVTAPYLAANDGTYVAVLYPEGSGERLQGRLDAYKLKYADADVAAAIDGGAKIVDYGYSWSLNE